MINTKSAFYVLCSMLIFTVGTGTLTSDLTRSDGFCPGEGINITCSISSSEEILQWRIRRAGQTISSIQFTFSLDQPPVTRMLTPNVVNAAATYISINPNGMVISFLILTATVQVNGLTIECNGVSTMDVTNIILASPPFSPRNAKVNTIANGTTSVIVSIDWDPPNGGGAVDRYIVETSPETATVRVTSDTRTATLDLSYNVRYIVRVTAENCGGNSTPGTMYPLEFVGCMLVSSKENVTLDPYTSSSVGSVIFYQCRPGFIPEGRVMSVCGGDGRWNPDPENFNCSYTVVCSPPLKPQNGFLEEVNASSLRFGCNEGYSPQGLRTAMCVATDTWSPDPAQLECTSTSTAPTATISSDGYISQPDKHFPDACSCQITATLFTSVVVVFSVVFFVCGNASGFLMYFVIMKCKKSDNSRRSKRNESPNPNPVYENASLTLSDDREKDNRIEIGLNDNIAYGPIRK